MAYQQTGPQSSIDPRLLRHLLAVYRAGSLVGAAEALSISQPALSVSISRLEDVLGAKVVDRGRHGATLTDLGAVLVRHATLLEQTLKNAWDEAKNLSSSVQGPLAIGGSPLASSSVIPAIVSRLVEEFGTVDIRIEEAADEVLTEKLLVSELDVVISNMDQVEVQGVEQTRLFAAGSIVMVRQGHHLAHRKQLSLNELTEETWVMPPAGGAFRRQLEALFTTNGVAFPKSLIQADPFGVLKAVILSTECVSILSDRFLRDDVLSGNLVAIPLKEGIAPRDFALKRLIDRPLNPLTERFVELADGFLATVLPPR